MTVTHSPLDAELVSAAAALLQSCRVAGLKLASAESCTGGLIAGYLTEVAGSSDVFERAFVTYSNEAKTELLDVSADVIKAEGAVSEAVVRAMVRGALEKSRADIAVAVSGVAGPGGGSAEKPVGLVHLAASRKGGETLHLMRNYGDIGRAEVRARTVADAFKLIDSLV